MMFYMLVRAAIFSGLFTLIAGEASASDIIERGEYLVRAGDCAACHTEAGGKPFAGGASIHSPYGPIYAPNLTPDRETGIGEWTDDQFYRALHSGVGKDGQFLYPAFPYQWYTKITRDDVLAIKAYLFSLPAVRRVNQQTKLRFPFDIRSGLAVWNSAFFRPGEFKPDPSKSAEVNRGAYLVEGLGHCGDCHTPRGYVMEPLTSMSYAGGVVDNWYAPNITSDKTRGIGGWSDEQVFQYLKTGLARGKPPVVGPMSQVVHESLSQLTDQDLRAIVAYVREIKPVADYAPQQIAALSDAHSPGEAVYLTHCAFCHQRDGKGREGAIPALAGSDVVQAKGPETVIRVVLGGLQARGTYAPMPAVGQEMSDQQIADVVTYVRNAWSNAAPPVKEHGVVEAVRKETYGMLAERASPNAKTDPCRASDDATPIPVLSDPQGKIGATLAKIDAVNMLPSVRSVIEDVRSSELKAKQADVVNGLTQAYCRAQQKAGAFGRTESRQLLNRFSQLVYTEIVSTKVASRPDASPSIQPQTQPRAKSRPQRKHHGGKASRRR